MRSLIFLFIVLIFCGCTKIKELLPQLSEKITPAGNIATKETEADHFVCMYPVEPDILDHEKWQQYLRHNLILDDASLDSIPAGRYMVMIQFVINSDGQISDVSIKKDPGYGLGKRAKDIISTYRNQGIPAETMMEAYKSYRMQPITFVVEEDDETKEE